MSLKKDERISDEQVKDMNEHEYVEHKPYTGPGCAICGRPRYVHDMARELRKLRAELLKEPWYVKMIRAEQERDKLAGALRPFIEAEWHLQDCCAAGFTARAQEARAALRELEAK
jgi:hypothetical protein